MKWTKIDCLNVWRLNYFPFLSHLLFFSFLAAAKVNFSTQNVELLKKRRLIKHVFRVEASLHAHLITFCGKGTCKKAVELKLLSDFSG